MPERSPGRRVQGVGRGQAEGTRPIGPSTAGWAIHWVVLWAPRGAEVFDRPLVLYDPSAVERRPAGVSGGRREVVDVGHEPFAVVLAEVDGVPVLRLRGELDIVTAPQFGTVLADVCNSGVSVVVNLAQLSFMDSSGLTVMTRAHTELSESGSRLVLAGVPRNILRLLEVTGFDRVFAICPDEKEALTLAATRFTG